MRYGSVCSGIEAATMAWHPLGWKPAFFSEIENFPSAVLAHHYPHVPNLGDMTKFQEWPDEPIDLLVGGTPCQSFSVAGLRAGLADPRGNLMLTYLAIAARYQPRWLVWENVPGVLSSNGGRDFGTLLRGLGELGYGFAYRVLDAQFCRAHGYEWAVPQRRRRVFVVGYLGDWRRAAAVLFDGTSLRGDPAPRREAGQRVAPTISARTKGGGGLGSDFEIDRGLIVADVASTLPAGGNSTGGDRQPGTSAETAASMLVAYSIQAGALRENPESGPDGVGVQADLAYTLEARSEVQAVAYDLRGREGGAQFEGPHETANIRAASGGSSRSYVALPWAVRRLTPLECTRLQGFPDDYFDGVRYRGKRLADGPIYKALGNSMAVNVMRVIGTRIAMVDAIAAEHEAAA